MLNTNTINDVRFVSGSVNMTVGCFDAVFGRLDRGASLRKHLGKRLHLAPRPVQQAASGQQADERYSPLSDSLSESWRMRGSALRPNAAAATATAQPPAPAWATLVINRALTI